MSVEQRLVAVVIQMRIKILFIIIQKIQKIV